MPAPLSKLSPLAFNVPITYPQTGFPTSYFQNMLQRWLVEKKTTDDLAADAVPGTRQVISGAGLTGGGNLSADITLDVGAGTGITVNSNDVAIDISAESERIRDVIGAALVAGSNITITVNDPGNTITIASTGGGGGSSSGWVLIDSFTFTGSETQYAFNSIPNTYKDLKLVFNGRSQFAGTTSTYILRCNSDTTSGNYVTNQINVVNTTVTGAFNNTNAGMFNMSYPAASATTGYSGVIEIDIINYNSTVFFKWMLATQATNNATGSTAAATRLISGHYRSLSAISSLLFLDTNSAAFVAGSIVSLYGRG